MIAKSSEVFEAGPGFAFGEAALLYNARGLDSARLAEQYNNSIKSLTIQNSSNSRIKN